MDPELVKALAEQGISVVLAGVVIYWYRSDSKERISEAKQQAENERADKLLILSALQGNTAAIGELTGAIKESIRERLLAP